MRSLTLDVKVWDEAVLGMMERIGNDVANEAWEAELYNDSVKWVLHLAPDLSFLFFRHALLWSALPCPALPCAALPCPALPRPALPCPALPCYGLPCSVLPDLSRALPYIVLPYHTP